MALSLFIVISNQSVQIRFLVWQSGHILPTRSEMSICVANTITLYLQTEILIITFTCLPSQMFPIAFAYQLNMCLQ